MIEYRVKHEFSWNQLIAGFNLRAAKVDSAVAILVAQPGGWRVTVDNSR